MTYAGIGLDARELSEVDHVALVLADAVRSRLGDAVGGDLEVATHWVPSATGSLAALSVGLPGLDQAATWQVLHATLSAGASGAPALVVGELGPGGPRGTERTSAARAAADLHARHSSGRLVTFSGSAALGEEVTVGDLLAGTAITRVRVLAGAAAGEHAVVVTRRHVRPVWTGGVLELAVQPAAGGRYVPFESPTPTACCALH